MGDNNKAEQRQWEAWLMASMLLLMQPQSMVQSQEKGELWAMAKGGLGGNLFIVAPYVDLSTGGQEGK